MGTKLKASFAPVVGIFLSAWLFAGNSTAAPVAGGRVAEEPPDESVDLGEAGESVLRETKKSTACGAMLEAKRLRPLEDETTKALPAAETALTDASQDLTKAKDAVKEALAKWDVTKGENAKEKAKAELDRLEGVKDAAIEVETRAKMKVETLKQAAAAVAGVKSEEELRQACIEESVELQSAATDLLHTLGQVVVDKALQSGWSLLEARLAKLAGCDDSKRERGLQKLERTCEALESATLENLIGEPETLLSAIVADLLTRALGGLELKAEQLKSAKLTEFSGALSTGLADAVAMWVRGDEASFVRVLGVALRKHLAEVGSGVECKRDEWGHATKVTWVAGQCVLAWKEGTITSYGECDFDTQLSQCYDSTNDASVIIEARQTLLLAADAFATGVDDEKRGAAMLSLYFDVVRYVLKDALAVAPEAEKSRLEKQISVVDALRELTVGVIERNWTRAMMGAGELVETGISIDEAHVKNIDELRATMEQLVTNCNGKSSNTQKKACRALDKAKKELAKLEIVVEQRRKLYALLAGAGHYATSYSETDADAAAAARKEAIEGMIAQLVRRSDRKSSAVFSLGGSFGLSAAYRGDLRGSGGTFAGPFHLALGAGLDTYHERKVGFHMEVSAFDLGQYVAFETSEFAVAKPDLRAAVAPGVKAGVWFASRNTPVFIAPFWTVSPFVQTESGEPTWQAGGMIGVYIPFVDFN